MDSVEVQLKVLMLAGLAGDAEAHRLLLGAAAARLRIYFGRRLGREAPDVEDLVQETLIAIHQRRDSFNPALPFTSWLHAIARYKLVDHFRRTGLRAHVPLDDIEEPAALDDIGPALAVADVDRLLDGLPEKQRTAIRLTRIEGYSVSEASQMTGQSPSGIKIGVHRGLKKLTARVRGEHGDTDDLIRDLAADLTPRRPAAGPLRLAAGIATGALASLAAISLLLGLPLGAVAYTGIPAFTMKLAFAAAMAVGSGILLLAAGRPGQPLGARLAWLLFPPILIVAAALMELVMTAPQFRQDAWLGSTWLTCLLAITGFSLPVLAGVAWAFRRLAPTRLRLAGFLAGTASGSAAAVVYALYCPETTATFLASWYMGGILAAGLIGLLVGPRLLRW